MSLFNKAVRRAVARQGQKKTIVSPDVLNRVITFFKGGGTEYIDMGNHPSIRKGNLLYVAVQSQKGSVIVLVSVQDSRVMYSHQRNRHYIECLVLQSPKQYIIAEGTRGKFPLEHMMDRQRRYVSLPRRTKEV